MTPNFLKLKKTLLMIVTITVLDKFEIEQNQLQRKMGHQKKTA